MTEKEKKNEVYVWNRKGDSSSSSPYQAKKVRTINPFTQVTKLFYPLREPVSVPCVCVRAVASDRETDIDIY